MSKRPARDKQIPRPYRVSSYHFSSNHPLIFLCFNIFDLGGFFCSHPMFRNAVLSRGRSKDGKRAAHHVRAEVQRCSALQNPLAQRVAEPGRCGGTGRTPRRPPACGTPARGGTRGIWHRCCGGTRREAARPSTPSGAGEPGEDAEPASSTPAPLRCAPQRASGAVGVASPDRGKRLTLSFYLYSLVPSSSKGSAKPGDARTADVH